MTINRGQVLASIAVGAGTYAGLLFVVSLFAYEEAAKPLVNMAGITLVLGALAIATIAIWATLQKSRKSTTKADDATKE